jgi:hypothetical protein
MQQPVQTLHSEAVKTATRLLVHVLWYRERFGVWPDSPGLMKSNAWRRLHRAEALDWLFEYGYMIKLLQSPPRYRVTDAGRELVRVPNLVRVSADQIDLYDLALPDNEDEQGVVHWVRLFYARNNTWPTPYHYRHSGLWRRSHDSFHQAVAMLVIMDKLAHIQISRGRKRVTRLVDVTYCPEVKYKDGWAFYGAPEDVM